MKSIPTALIGVNAEERAMTRMWTRRVDLYIVEPMLNGFAPRGIPSSRAHAASSQAAEDLKTLAQEKITWLDGLIAGRDFIAGPRFTLADILLFCTMDFTAKVGQPVNRDNGNIAAWFDRVNARPSAEKSKA
jgi:glutathione S-transferase